MPRSRIACLATLLLAALAAGGERKLPSDGALKLAAEMVQQSGAPGGICAVVGAADADLALALARQGSFVVQCLCPDAAARDAVRAAIRARGAHGEVSADLLPPDGRLPYANNLLNILAITANARVPDAEAVRVLAPYGALSRQKGGNWTHATKPWPKDIDQWTHYLHGPDGNPVARDRVVGPPRHFQWVSEPVWLRSHETDSSVSTLVTARGRLFAIVDEAPISLAGQHSPPDKWFLVARDAFNGVLLWKVPIRRWGWREWKPSWFTTRPGDIPLNIQKRLVATADHVYVTLGFRAPVSQLDARTGDLLQTYAGTERTNEILLFDRTLVLSVLASDTDGARLMALDAATGKHKWVTRTTYRGTTTDYIRWKAMHGATKPAKLDPALNIATDGKVVALIHGGDIACLDFATGAEKWRKPFPSDPADERAGGIRAHGNLWVGTMIVADGVVLHASPSKLAAFDAATGKLLWTQPKKYLGHLWYEWKDVFVIDGLAWTWSADLAVAVSEGRGRPQRARYPRTVNGYDLHTGKLVRQVPINAVLAANHHHRCYRNKATLRFILASRRGTEFIDLEGGRHTVHNWVRGTCHVGMMPANGLHYAPPHPCACYIDEKLNGMLALAPASAGPPHGVAQPDAPRLERGPAFGSIAGPPAAEGDWPAFRHDPARTGAATTRVPDGAELLWRVPVGRRLSPPIAVGGRLFLALVDEHRVACLDAATGKKQWEFPAGARVDSPPTYHRGSLLFGSADGWVYCLRASDGTLAWRFRAAPARRLVSAFGQLESAWPVHGSVLVLDQPPDAAGRAPRAVAYFAAGRTSHLDGGIRLYALDAATGKVLHQATLEGPDYAAGDFKINFGLPMGTLPDILSCEGDRIFMRARAFDRQLKPQAARPALLARAGFLDDNYFKRVPWTFAGDYARLIVRDARAAYYLRMFDTLRGLDPTVYFTPGSKGYLLFARDAANGRKAWAQRVPIRARAMTVAGDRLFVAGPPDVVDPKDPLGAFEGRKGGVLRVADAATGNTVAEHRLPSPPVFNGVAAAGGRLFLACEDGSLACFGAP